MPGLKGHTALIGCHEKVYEKTLLTGNPYDEAVQMNKILLTHNHFST